MRRIALPAAGERGMPSRRYVVILLAITVLGVGARIAFSYGPADEGFVPVDAQYSVQVGTRWATGEGYTSLGADGDPRATAQLPPLHTLTLGVLHKVGFGTEQAMRVGLSLLSAIAIVAVGALGRRLGGDAVGLLAAGIAAFHPMWFQLPGTLMSEATYVLVASVVLWLAVRYVDVPTWWNLVALAGSIGIAVLTRSDALLL